MGKLLVVLLLGLYLAFQLGGQDPSQLRPGLVNAGVDPASLVIVEPVETRALTSAEIVPEPRTTPTEATIIAAKKPVAPKAEIVQATFSPDPAPSAVTRQADKVFTLSVLPGQQKAPAADVQTEVATPAPDVWYVTGRSVNVRADPTTDAPIVGKLYRGDAALVLADNGAGWAQVTVEGDGVSGYVSMDFLSQSAP
jgi:Bacterial SH3 domain